MSKFVIDQSFWDLFPDATIGVLLLKDYKNSEQSPQELVDMLAESNKIAAKFITEEVFSENKVVKVWREALVQDQEGCKMQHREPSQEKPGR